jgi:hypothetical protein
MSTSYNPSVDDKAKGVVTKVRDQYGYFFTRTLVVTELRPFITREDTIITVNTRVKVACIVMLMLIVKFYIL